MDYKKSTNIEIIGDRPISEEAISEARYRFLKATGVEPTRLTMGPSAETAFRTKIAVDNSFMRDRFSSYMGMVHKVDYDIDSNSWSVGRPESKTYDLNSPINGLSKAFADSYPSAETFDEITNKSLFKGLLD